MFLNYIDDKALINDQLFLLSLNQHLTHNKDGQRMA